MSLLLIVSILVRIAALGWAICVWHRLRDWRMGFLTGMLALMVIRQSLTFWSGFESPSIDLTANLDEIPGLVVSVLALLAVYYLGEMILEHHKTETYLQQSQKMDAIGRLAGGVAHDFNNLLTVIHGFADVLRTDLEKGTPEHDAAMEIIYSAERGAGLTRQLLALVRRKPRDVGIVNVNEVLEDMRGMLQRLIREDITLRVEKGPGNYPVIIDRGHLEQIIINLVVNARDATESGGEIVVSTRSSRTPRNAIPRAERPANGYVALAVADSGQGMDELTRSRMFEPFFSTKTPEKGTGLGLATVHAIVSDVEGIIDVDSETGEGTTVYVQLPIAGDQAPLPEEDTGSYRSPTSPATIVVAEDNRAVRELITSTLEADGHTVHAFSGAREALQECRARCGQVDIVITDLVMPGMSGVDFCSQLRAEQPRIASILISGYLERPEQNDESENDSTAFLAKPFGPAELRVAVVEARKAA